VLFFGEKFVDDSGHKKASAKNIHKGFKMKKL